MNIEVPRETGHRSLFIVLDGTASVGKGVQSKLLLRQLQKEGCRVTLYGFPRYKVAPYGPLVEQYQDSGFGDPLKINPYYASYPYMLDRMHAQAELAEELNQGNIVVCDRYVSSNVAYQGAKLVSENGNLTAAEGYINHQLSLEYEHEKLLREDLLIYLNVPWHVCKRLALKRQKETGQEGLDGQEQSDSHMERVAMLYLELARSLPYARVIDCATPNGDDILPPEEVAAKIWPVVRAIL